MERIWRYCVRNLVIPVAAVVPVFKWQFFISYRFRVTSLEQKSLLDPLSGDNFIVISFSSKQSLPISLLSVSVAPILSLENGDNKFLRTRILWKLELVKFWKTDLYQTLLRIGSVWKRRLRRLRIERNSDHSAKYEILLPDHVRTLHLRNFTTRIDLYHTGRLWERLLRNS